MRRCAPHRLKPYNFKKRLGPKVLLAYVRYKLRRFFLTSKLGIARVLFKFVSGLAHTALAALEQPPSS